MRSHRQKWVEAALDKTGADNAIELLEGFKSGEFNTGSNMVTQGNAIDFCNEYIRDVSRLCESCKVERMEGDDAYICPNCKHTIPYE